MSVVAPRRPPDADERSLDERVAELEALIEEARRRARRRRVRNGVMAMLAVSAALAATFAGGDGLRAGAGRSSDTAPAAPVGTAGIGQWSVPYGPLPGSWLGSIVVDPQSPANVYAAAGGRVFRSTDGGRSWSGALQIDPRVDTLAIDPERPSTLYAGTGEGVFKSVDAGRSWAWSGLGQTPRLPGGPRGEGNVGSLVVDPTDSNVVYAVAGVAGGQVSKSTDGGRTWHLLAASPRSGALAIDAANPQTMFAAVEGAWMDGKGHSSIAMTTDGGATWHTVLSEDGNIWAVAVDPAGPGTVYAVGTAGVLVTADSGRTWASAGKAPDHYLTGLAVDPRDPSTIYVSSWQKGVFRTTDGGRTWSSLGGDLDGPIAVDPHEPSTLYVGTRDGISKTLDGGRTWKPADTGIVASEVLSTASDPGNANVVYAGTPRGLFRSDDRGRTWKALRVGLSVEAVAVDPANSAHVLASGVRGILISTDEGRTWANAAGSSVAKAAARQGKHVTAIVFDPHHPGNVFAAAWGAGVIRSTDGGLSWHRAARRPAWISSLAGTVAVAPTGSDVLYGSTNGALIRSTNEGASWKWIFLPKVGAIVALLAVDPFDPQTIYASIGDRASRLEPPHLARSVDGGSHWRLLRWGTAAIDATALVIDPRDPSTMYAATRFQGVLRSTDGGSTWRAFNRGLLARAIDTLTLDRTGSTLYAGTDGAGVVSIRLR